MAREHAYIRPFDSMLQFAERLGVDLRAGQLYAARECGVLGGVDRRVSTARADYQLRPVWPRDG